MQRAATIRRAVLALTALAVIPAVIFFQAAPAAANNPNAPSGITADEGDTEVKVSWTTPTGTTCPASDYFLRIYTDGYLEVAAEAFTPDNEYTVVGLTAGTDYIAELWTYSAACNDYSLLPADVAFTTNSTNDDTNDPEPAADAPLLAPNPPTNVQVATNSNTAAINWTASASSSNHCSVTDYAILVDNLTDDTVDDTVVYDITGTSESVSGLTAGDEYDVYVWAYSADCSVWSSDGMATFTNN